MKITKKENPETLKFEEVELTEALTGDLIRAERITGKAEGIEYLAAVISQVAVFDGKKLPPEELYGLSATDLTALGNAAIPTPEAGGGKQ